MWRLILQGYACNGTVELGRTGGQVAYYTWVPNLSDSFGLQLTIPTVEQTLKQCWQWSNTLLGQFVRPNGCMSRASCCGPNLIEA